MEENLDLEKEQFESKIPKLAAYFTLLRVALPPDIEMKFKHNASWIPTLDDIIEFADTLQGDKKRLRAITKKYSDMEFNDVRPT